MKNDTQMDTRHTHQINKMKTPAIISWNIQGIRTSKQELQIIINDFEPAILCLQETMCKNDTQASIRGYQVIHRKRQTGNRSAGGLITAIKEGIDFEEIQTDTNMEITVIKVANPINATVVNVYIPPNVVIDKHEILDMLTKLEKPYIILGDMNAHHHLWGSDFINNRGSTLEEIFNEKDLSVLNNGDYTYINHATGKGSCIDIVSCTDDLTGTIEFEVYEDTLGSDHFPIIMTLTTKVEPTIKMESWKINEANWELYSNSVYFREKSTCEEQITEITTQILEAAEKTIPTTKGPTGKKQVPWWNAEVAAIVKARRKALRKLKNKKITEDNRHIALGEFQALRQEAREVISKAQKQSWEEFANSFSVNTPTREIWNNLRKLQGKYKNSTIRQIKHK